MKNNKFKINKIFFSINKQINALIYNLIMI